MTKIIEESEKKQRKGSARYAHTQKTKCARKEREIEEKSHKRQQNQSTNKTFLIFCKEKKNRKIEKEKTLSSEKEGII